MHARISDNLVVEYPIINLRQHLPNVSLPVDLTDSSVLPEGFVWVQSINPPAHNPTTHKLVAFAPRLQDGAWIVGYEVVPLAPGEISPDVAAGAEQVRAERNQLLVACDWTQLTDAPVDRDAWATYRQALRDVTAQPGFPFDVQWPVKPV